MWAFGLLNSCPFLYHHSLQKLTLKPMVFRGKRLNESEKVLLMSNELIIFLLSFIKDIKAYFDIVHCNLND
jgi:hypothetical protein